VTGGGERGVSKVQSRSRGSYVVSYGKRENGKERNLKGGERLREKSNDDASRKALRKRKTKRIRKRERRPKRKKESPGVSLRYL